MPHISSTFGLIVVFVCNLRMLKEVLRTCSHLMQHPSWDACKCFYVKFLNNNFKKNFSPIQGSFFLFFQSCDMKDWEFFSKS
jgi:hypothetical protein